NFAVWNESAPDLPAFNIRAVINDRDRCVADRLCYFLTLAFARDTLPKGCDGRTNRNKYKRQNEPQTPFHFSNFSFARPMNVRIISETFFVISLLIRVSPAMPASICRSRAERRRSSTICVK